MVWSGLNEGVPRGYSSPLSPRLRACVHCPARAAPSLCAGTAHGPVCAATSREDLGLDFWIPQFSTSASGTQHLWGELHAVDSQNATHDIWSKYKM